MLPHFADRLAHAIREKKSVVCVGLDPRLEKLPAVVRENTPPPAAATAFCLAIIDAVADVVPAVKPNIAFFESFGVLGVAGYAEVCRRARERGLLVIGDVKRGDIGSTAEAYARGLLGPCAEGRAEDRLCHHDAVTINAYLGADGVLPFAMAARGNGQGLFLLVKTSNPTSAELQDLELAAGGTVAQEMARLVETWGADCRGECGYSHLGAVVGATHGAELADLRARMPHAPLLLPGYGAQGAGAEDIIGAFGRDGLGGLVNASRSIIFAGGRDADFAAAARKAAILMRDEINEALARAGKSIPEG
jgi:orotidine-5'-phosphate decarboxylase